MLLCSTPHSSLMCKSSPYFPPPCLFPIPPNCAGGMEGLLVGSYLHCLLQQWHITFPTMVKHRWQKINLGYGHKCDWEQDLQSFRSPSCDAFWSKMLELRYSYLWLVSQAGFLVTSTLPVPGAQTLWHLKWRVWVPWCTFYHLQIKQYDMYMAC